MSGGSVTSTRPRRTALRRRTLVAAALAAVVAAAGCGLPLDDAPRSLASTTTTEPSATTTAPEAAEAGSSATAFVFFVADNQLINVDADVPRADAESALAALFAGVPGGDGNEIVSQIATGTRLLGVRQVGSTVVVDVSSEFDNLVGTARTQATAQIVMTATDLTGIDQVALRIDGQPTQVFSPTRGDTDQVGPCDYLGLMPGEDVVSAWPIDRRSRQHLITRRNMLVAQCPAQPSDG